MSWACAIYSCIVCISSLQSQLLLNKCNQLCLFLLELHLMSWVCYDLHLVIFMLCRAYVVRFVWYTWSTCFGRACNILSSCKYSKTLPDKRIGILDLNKVHASLFHKLIFCRSEKLHILRCYYNDEAHDMSGFMQNICINWK